jgi:hypothetical protein
VDLTKFPAPEESFPLGDADPFILPQALLADTPVSVPLSTTSKLGHDARVAPLTTGVAPGRRYLLSGDDPHRIGQRRPARIAQDSGTFTVPPADGLEDQGRVAAAFTVHSKPGRGTGPQRAAPPVSLASRQLR